MREINPYSLGISPQAPWRFLDTGLADPYFNMAVDEAIARFGARGHPPTLRVYGWRPAAISIGYSQRIRQALNVKACAQRGVPVVRRLTGGRMVFHDQELTYSIIAPRGLVGLGGSVLGTYKRIGQALVASLRRLGISAYLQRMSCRYDGLGAAHGLEPCFTRSGRYEVMVDGRKVAGSAQRWIGQMVLQHGSLLMGDGHLRVAQFLSPECTPAGDRMVQHLKEKTISLGVLLPRPVSYSQVAEAMVWGFQESFGVTLEPGRLRSDECSLAQRLIRQRYGRQEWTLRR